MKTTLIIKGMHCSACKALIEEVCGELTGVEKCDVHVEEGVAKIEHHVPLDQKQLIHEIESLGVYKILDVQDGDRDDALKAH